jgi:hypothetical protein
VYYINRPLMPIVPSIRRADQDVVTSGFAEHWDGKFSIALHISYPKGVLSPMTPPTLNHKTARPSQKKRYQTVAQLAPDHLTYTDGEIQLTAIGTVWRSSQQWSPTRGGRS